MKTHNFKAGLAMLAIVSLGTIALTTVEPAVAQQGIYHDKQLDCKRYASVGIASMIAFTQHLRQDTVAMTLRHFVNDENILKKVVSDAYNIAMADEFLHSEHMNYANISSEEFEIVRTDFEPVFLEKCQIGAYE